NFETPIMAKTCPTEGKNLSSTKTPTLTSSGRKRNTPSKSPTKTPMPKLDIPDENPVDLKRKRANIGSIEE
ncbi:hypothetical protein TorRG33x02_153040, partial [Trema orientale]